jgi:hypothetical protein
MRVGWLIESTTWGPTTRAVAVLGPGSTHVDGVVLGHRSPEDNVLLDYEKIPYIHAGCCGDDSMEAHLARLDVDVLVADMCWRNLAAADGRPHIVMGMHGAGMWDLDSMPLHPWAWQQFGRRIEIRALFGAPPDVPVVAFMSNATRERVIENALEEHVPEGAISVSLTGPFVARQFVGADLVVTSAGWGSAWEARWSGVAYVLVDVGGPDQPQRATHTWEQAAEAIAQVTVADLPPDHVPERVDHVSEFAHVLDLLAEGALT